MSIAGDAVWVLSNKTTLNVRGSFYNMVDEFYNPALLLGEDGLADYWPNDWYSSLYNSGYVYYPALDVTSGTGTNANNRLGRQGREWYQHPDAWTAVGAHEPLPRAAHNLKWGGETRAYYGEAARFEPINLVFNSTLTANSSDSPQVATTGNQWATLPARRARQPDVGAAGAAADDQPARLLGLLPGRLEGRRSADAEPRPPLGVRAGRDRSGQPAVAGPRPHAADSRDAGDAAATCRPRPRS